MKPAEIRALSDAELLNELENAQQRLFNLHFQRTIQNLDSTADLSQARKDIARLQTILGQRAGRVRPAQDQTAPEAKTPNSEAAEQ